LPTSRILSGQTPGLVHHHLPRALPGQGLGLLREQVQQLVLVPVLALGRQC
jgi:hypothetical protein